MFSRDIKIDIDYSLILKNKVPLLIKDDSWKKIFGSIEERDLVNCKNNLVQLLDEQKNINRGIHRLKLQKKKLMDEILKISDEVNNKKDNRSIEKLKECKMKILHKNEEIDDLTFKNEMLPKTIKQANYKLLKETIRYAYKGLKEKQVNLESVNKEVENLRTELRELVEKKHDYEESINTTYSFLHGILGSKEMEKLDKNLL